MSSVPDVLSALVSIGTTALDSSLQTFYGQPGTSVGPRFFAVGWAEEGPAVQQVFAVDNAAMVADHEDYTVVNQLVSLTGSPDGQNTVVADVYAQLALLSAEIEGDRTLGGVCTQAVITDASLTLARTTKGPLAQLAVSVHVINYP